MRMMCRFAVAALLISSTAAADPFGGFSTVAAPYLISPDRVCEPLAVVQGVATGVPTCARTPADTIAKLAFKAGIAQRGPTAPFSAMAAGNELVVSRSGRAIIAWRTVDPISRILDVYASQSGDRVAVSYVTRRLGKEVVDVVAFATEKPAEPLVSADAAAAPESPTPAAVTNGADPALAQRVTVARAAPKKKAMAAWQRVLDLDRDHSEALYQTARIHVRSKHAAAAVAALESLERSSRQDAIEWLVEARFDPAFAAVRSRAAYRAAVGLDRPAKTDYERVMGFGGRWEQVATCGEKPHVVLTTRRDRTFSLTVSVHCGGIRHAQTFAGRWRIDPAPHSLGGSAARAGGADAIDPAPHSLGGSAARAGGADAIDRPHRSSGSGESPSGARVVLALPPAKGVAASDKDEASCLFKQVGDEQALTCTVGQDLDFEVLPTRR